MLLILLLLLLLLLLLSLIQFLSSLSAAPEEEEGEGEEGVVVVEEEAAAAAAAASASTSRGLKRRISEEWAKVNVEKVILKVYSEGLDTIGCDGMALVLSARLGFSVASEKFTI